MEKMEEILNDQTGNKFKDVTEELIKVDNITGTPFTTVTTDDGTFVAMGKYRLTDVYEHKEDAILQASTNNWEFILSVMYAVLINNEKQAK